MLYAVSACLTGENCKYNGGNNYNEKVCKICEENRHILVCPEVTGGLPENRPPAEIKGGDGRAVLDGKARVYDREGNDVTREFVDGAYASLRDIIEAAEEGEEIVAILRMRSPSCGTGQIYDGSFSKKLIEGDGVTAALYKEKGIRVYRDEDDELDKILEKR